jgi:hypothetical protein
MPALGKTPDASKRIGKQPEHMMLAETAARSVEPRYFQCEVNFPFFNTSWLIMCGRWGAGSK